MPAHQSNLARQNTMPEHSRKQQNIHLCKKLKFTSNAWPYISTTAPHLSQLDHFELRCRKGSSPSTMYLAYDAKDSFEPPL
jgi:hypothetical protein